MSTESMAMAATAAAHPHRKGPPPRLRVLWAYALPVGLLHVLACAAAIPWLFSWPGLIAMVIGVHVYGQAINIGYHRMFSHRSFRVPRWLERTIVFVALCCLQDTPARWVATHRLHHNHSDEPPDPHTPKVSLFWSHIGWLIYYNPAIHTTAVYEKYAKDLLSDPWYMKLEKNPWLAPIIYAAHAAVYFLVGLAVGWGMTGQALDGLQFGLSLLVWGVILRTVVVWHITWSVNSLTHAFGYSPHATGEGSRNNWLVALFSVGEGWHNNHHADPASATVQHRWWELDISYYEIKLLEWLGLASNVRPPKHRRRAKSGAADDIAEDGHSSPDSALGQPLDRVA